jgi:membrane-associated phospholipid phosphatase
LTGLNNHHPTSSVAGRLRSQLGLKLILLVVLNVLVYEPYIYLQHHHFFPAMVMPVSSLDRLVPFIPQTVWIYLSLYLLMPIGPFLMQRRGELLGYASGIVLIGVIADVIFILWPSMSPRPEVPVSNPAYRALISVDNSFHAFPSLHAAFAVYSAMCGIFVLRESARFQLWRPGLWVWAFLILLATLTTKQHVLADILAGSTLGFMIFTAVFARRKSPFTSQTVAPTSPNPKRHENQTPAPRRHHRHLLLELHRARRRPCRP